MSGIPPNPEIVNGQAAGRVVLVCEHAANAFPPPWDRMAVPDDLRQTHVAWDPGALGVARGLSQALDAVLIHATASRLIYDLNRPPDAAAAMPERSEIHDIAANRDLTAEDRLRRTRALYTPFHAALSALIADRLARGIRPVLVTVHSFTPIWFGQPRAVEFGIIHDRDDRLALALALAARDSGLVTRLNEPYSATDGVAHTLALHATPLGLPHAMLEIRNDLIATPQAQADMAARLAPAICAAMNEVD